jgi:glycosyltransferase involved in cell wall biosynthesis
MSSATVVIPIGPGHESVAERAVASVHGQTVPTALITVRDTQQRGPGWARNQGLAQVETDYVVFLDADDWLNPQFVGQCLAVRKPGRYVYTDWYTDEVAQAAPDKAWCGGTWHVITTLIPTAWVRRIGGFDESLPGAEDTDFYLKLTTQRQCGQRLAEPLFHYGQEGTRAYTFVHGPEHDTVMSEINRRYRGLMGCCGDEINQPPVGERQPGDVMALALWGGNRQQLGTATGRMYPRTGNYKVTWVDPRDVATRPDLWRLVEEPTVDDPLVLTSTDAIGRAMMANVKPSVFTPSNPGAAPVQTSTPPTPDVSTVLRLAKGKHDQ